MQSARAVRSIKDVQCAFFRAAGRPHCGQAAPFLFRLRAAFYAARRAAGGNRASRRQSCRRERAGERVCRPAQARQHRRGAALPAPMQSARALSRPARIPHKSRRIPRQPASPAQKAFTDRQPRGLSAASGDFPRDARRFFLRDMCTTRERRFSRACAAIFRAHNVPGGTHAYWPRRSAG